MNKSKCEVCGKSFGNKSHLNRHKMQVHTQQQGTVYKCEFCEKTFMQKCNLEMSK